jgi:hypothetical protein
MLQVSGLTPTLSVNSGNNNTIRNSVCIGGHGSSISAANGVSNVLFEDITMIDSLYASASYNSALCSAMS